jgi:hypothetical protein
MVLGGGGPLDQMTVIESGDLTPTDVLVDGDTLYVVESYPVEPEEPVLARLRLFDVGGLPEVRELGALGFDSQPRSRGLALMGGRLLLPASRVPLMTGPFVLGEGKEDLLVVAVSGASRPSALGFVSLDGYSKDIALFGDSAYVAAGRDAVRFDRQEGESLIVLPGVFEPGGPRARWVVGLPAVPRSVAVRGDYAAVAMREAGLAVVDVRPEVIGRPTEPPTASNVPPPSQTAGPGTVTATLPATATPLATETPAATSAATGTPPTGGRVWLPAAATGR